MTLNFLGPTFWFVLLLLLLLLFSEEIVVNKTMFSDHLPERYQLNEVSIPDEFDEPLDTGNEILSPSPPTHNQHDQDGGEYA